MRNEVDDERILGVAARLKFVKKGPFGLLKYWTEPLDLCSDLERKARGNKKAKGLKEIGKVTFLKNTHGYYGEVRVTGEDVMKLATEDEFSDANAFTYSVEPISEVYFGMPTTRKVEVTFFQTEKMPEEVKAQPVIYQGEKYSVEQIAEKEMAF